MNTTVKNLFTTFCEVYNLRTRDTVTLKRDNPQQPEFYSNDFVKLDYEPAYGGYYIAIVYTTTAQGAFESLARKSSKEMIAFLKGLIAAKNEYNFKGIVKKEL